ncbi:PD-(D/E)XK nuclease family protein [Pirellulales bacterium]|nr:PD-(D/E)XK nuclease family protein [Pirellulales bacterium]
MKPSLEVLHAPPGWEWTPVIVDRYVAQLRQGIRESRPWPAAWITVNYAAAVRFRDHLAQIGPLLAHGVGTFDSFAETVLKQSGRSVRPITRQQRRQLLRRLIHEHAESRQLDYYQHVADKPGFLDQVDTLITDLKRNYIWPEQFSQSAPDTKRKELAGLYAAYQQRLHNANLYDAQGCFWAASDALQADPDLAARIGLLVVDGFTDFTLAQQRVLEQLSTRCDKIAITLPLETPGDSGDGQAHGRPNLFAKSHDTLAALRKTFDVKMVVPTDDARPEPAPALVHIGRELFRGAPRCTADLRTICDEIHVIEAAGDDSEVRQVAREVKQLLLNGVAAEEVVVARRGLADSADRFRAVLADYGIPFRIEAAPSLAAAPIVRSLLNLLRLHVEDWPYRTLLRAINDQLLGGLESQARIASEHCVRKAQFPDGRKRLLALANHWAKGTGSADATRAATTLAELDAALAALPSSAPRDEWVAALEATAGALGMSLRDYRAWQSVTRGLRSLVRIERWTELESGPASPADMLAAITTIAREERLPDGGSPAAAVRIVEADTLRGMRPRHLFLTGLGESSFPTTRRSNAAGESAASSLSPVDAHSSEEMLLFYQLVTRPTDGLTLSYAALDDRAQQLEPSPYVADLKRVFAAGQLKVTRIGLIDRTVGGAPLSRTEQRLAAVSEALDGACDALAAMTTTAETGPAATGALAAMEAIAARAGRDAFTPWEGMFNSPPAEQRMAERFGPQHTWSATQLESYASCPYQFLAEHAMGLQPLEDLSLRSDPRRRGTLMHHALAKAHRELLDVDDRQLREEIVDRFLKALDEIVASHPQQGLDAALREIQRRELIVWGEKLAKQTETYQAKFANLDVPLRPRYYEVRFGPRRSGRPSADVIDDDDATLSTDKPYLLRLGEEEIQFTGQIDRIDIGEHDGRVIFNVIDYKSKEKERFEADSAAAGQQLQLPLYAMAAEELLLEKTGALAWEAGYWSVAGDGFVWTKRGKPQDQLKIRTVDDGTLKVTAAWEQLHEAVTARVASLIAGVRGAAFPVYNPNEDCTRYCDFSKICRISHVRSLEKTWES